MPGRFRNRELPYFRAITPLADAVVISAHALRIITRRITSRPIPAHFWTNRFSFGGYERCESSLKSLASSASRGRSPRLADSPKTALAVGRRRAGAAQRDRRGGPAMRGCGQSVAGGDDRNSARIAARRPVAQRSVDTATLGRAPQSRRSVAADAASARRECQRPANGVGADATIGTGVNAGVGRRTLRPSGVDARNRRERQLERTPTSTPSRPTPMRTTAMPSGGSVSTMANGGTGRRRIPGCITATAIGRPTTPRNYTYPRGWNNGAR